MDNHLEYMILPEYLNYRIYYTGDVYNKRYKKYQKKHIRKDGRIAVSMTDNNGKTKTVLLHRLIADVFIPNPHKLGEVAFKDGDTTNCHLDNLYRKKRTSIFNRKSKAVLMAEKRLQEQ